MCELPAVRIIVQVDRLRVALHCAGAPERQVSVSFQEGRPPGSWEGRWAFCLVSTLGSKATPESDAGGVNGPLSSGRRPSAQTPLSSSARKA